MIKPWCLAGGFLLYFLFSGQDSGSSGYGDAYGDTHTSGYGDYAQSRSSVRQILKSLLSTTLTVTPSISSSLPWLCLEQWIRPLCLPPAGISPLQPFISGSRVPGPSLGRQCPSGHQQPHQLRQDSGPREMLWSPTESQKTDKTKQNKTTKQGLQKKMKD